MQLGYSGSICNSNSGGNRHSLWTTGGEISKTLTLVFLSWSLRHSTNEFSAALEAEYAGKVAAGTIAR